MNKKYTSLCPFSLIQNDLLLRTLFLSCSGVMDWDCYMWLESSLLPSRKYIPGHKNIMLTESFYNLYTSKIPLFFFNLVYLSILEYWDQRALVRALLMLTVITVTKWFYLMILLDCLRTKQIQLHKLSLWGRFWIFFLFLDTPNKYINYSNTVCLNVGTL